MNIFTFKHFLVLSSPSLRSTQQLTFATSIFGKWAELKRVANSICKIRRSVRYQQTKWTPAVRTAAKILLFRPNLTKEQIFLKLNGRVLTSSSPDIGAGLDYVLTGLDSVSHW